MDTAIGTSLLPKKNCSCDLDHQKQPASPKLSIFMPDLQDQEVFDGFEMDPGKTSTEEDTLEQPSSTPGGVVFDFGLSVLPLDNEQQIGDDMDDYSTFSNEDSIVVAKRRREQRNAQEKRDRCEDSPVHETGPSSAGKRSPEPTRSRTAST